LEGSTLLQEEGKYLHERVAQGMADIWPACWRQLNDPPVPFRTLGQLSSQPWMPEGSISVSFVGLVLSG